VGVPFWTFLPCFFETNFAYTLSGEWIRIYEYTGHKLSVNSIAWGPHEFGKLTLLCGSSDGFITVHTHQVLAALFFSTLTLQLQRKVAIGTLQNLKDTNLA
jgi:hypothetical protein